VSGLFKHIEIQLLGENLVFVQLGHFESGKKNSANLPENFTLQSWWTIVYKIHTGYSSLQTIFFYHSEEFIIDTPTNQFRNAYKIWYNFFKNACKPVLFGAYCRWHEWLSFKYKKALITFFKLLSKTKLCRNYIKILIFGDLCEHIFFLLTFHKKRSCQKFNCITIKLKLDF